MPRVLAEPVKIYWAIGIAASLALHASGVAGAVLLADRYTRKAVATEITFSDAASPAIAPAETAREVASASETATVAEPERLTPAAAEATAIPASETLAPVATEAGQMTERETLAPSASDAAATLSPEAAQPLDGAMPQTADIAAPETLSSAQPETLSSAEPETGGVSGVRPETIVAGSGEAVQPATASEALSGSQPEVAPVATPEDAGPIASTSFVSTAEPAQSETAVAAAEGSASSAETISQTETVGPVISQGSGAEQAVSVPGGQETVAPIERPLETALLVPARPGSVLGSEVDKPSDRYRRIVDFVRGYVGGDCFIALPAMSPAGAVTFQTFGRDKAREDAFRNALLGLDGLQAEISSGNVADPQCLALSFARDIRRYPGFSLIIDLDEADMKSGTRLSGSILNAKGRELHLLLVDNDGLVQSIDSFLRPGDGTDRPFSAPLVLTGGPVVTKQILIAVATDDRLAALSEPVNEPADSYFRRLGEEIQATGADIDLAVEGFSVR